MARQIGAQNMKITFQESPSNSKTDLLVLGLFEDEKLPKNLSTENEKIINHIQKLITNKQIKPDIGSTYTIPILDTEEVSVIGIVGLGKKDELNAESARLIGGHIIAVAKANKTANIKVAIDSLNQLALAEGLYLGDYQFTEYKSKSDDDFIIESVAIITKQRVDITKIKEIEQITDGVKFVRNLVNKPASQVYPRVLADEAERIAKNSNGLITATIMDKAELTKMGANAISAVASGSEHEPYLIHLVYDPKDATRSVAVVGKGVTFDSGGLSLKPGEALEDMKSDMAGAATVLGVFGTLSTFQPHITVHGIIPCVENMLSDRSMRVGDVIKTLSGKTVEVLNTDAEGRLILADALTYAEKQKPDAIVDLATLTGACIVALGEQYSGIMGDKELINELMLSSNNSGEKLWELPLPDEYKEKMKSDVADISNVHKGRAAGAIMGGLFLKEFISHTSWAHIDIAGPSYNRTPLNSYTSSGASGFGVRLLLNWISNF